MLLRRPLGVPTTAAGANSERLSAVGMTQATSSVVEAGGQPPHTPASAAPNLADIDELVLTALNSSAAKYVYFYLVVL